MRELLRLLPSDTDKPNRLQVAIGENQVQFVFGEITILSKLIEGAYPDWNRIIPPDNNIATLPRAELLRSVERIALVADDIHMEFTGSALYLKSHGKRGNELVGDATDCLLIASNVKPGVPAECVFSTRYLRDALAATADDSLEFHLAPTRLCLLKAPTRDWRAVIAPVKKEEKKPAKPAAETPAKQAETPAKQAETPCQAARTCAPEPAQPVVKTKKPELVDANETHRHHSPRAAGVRQNHPRQSDRSQRRLAGGGLQPAQHCRRARTSQASQAHHLLHRR